MENNKLSIIIPVYNLEKYISKCLDSIINQIKENIEIIIVNDGSTDKTEDICNKYCERYSYIKYFYQRNNGVSSARNLGLSKATGEYVLFIDGDDWLLEDAISKILLELEEEYDIFLGDFVKSFNGKIMLKGKKDKNLKLDVNKMKYPENFIYLFKNELYNLSLWCNIIRRQLFYSNNIRLDTNIKYTEDMDCMLQLLLSTNKIKLMIDPIYVYRQDTQDSATSKWTNERVNNTMYFVDKWYNNINYSNLDEQIKRYIIDFIRYQYCIALGIDALVPKKGKRDVNDKIEKYRFLLNDAYGKKQKMVRITYKILGFKMTCKLMGFWIKNKSKVNI